MFLYEFFEGVKQSELLNFRQLLLVIKEETQGLPANTYIGWLTVHNLNEKKRRLKEPLLDFELLRKKVKFQVHLTAYPKLFEGKEVCDKTIVILTNRGKTKNFKKATKHV